MMISDSIAAAITDHAKAEAPRECCGLLVELADGLDYWPCRNRSPLLGQFELHPADWADAEDVGTIKAVVHSHVVTSEEPSQADVQRSEEHTSELQSH